MERTSATVLSDKHSDMRSLAFRDREQPRYWWHRMERATYVPPVYSWLHDDEWRLLEAWFSDTDEKYSPGTGECGVPLMSILQGFIMGSAMRGIVQCGHYIGYSTLLIGFMLRHMGQTRALFSVDIDPTVTAYTQAWVDDAGLGDYVHLEIGDSADSSLPAKARDYFDGDIELVFIDSAHQYEHTIDELETWYDELKPGGLAVLHDVSRFAAGFDSTRSGGVGRGLSEWSVTSGRASFMLNGFVGAEAGPPGYVPYADGCGLGLIQRPAR